MMFKKFLFKLLFFATPLLIWSCEDQVASLEPPVTPSNLVLNIEIASDSSGMVTFTPTADNALTYQIFPGDESGVQTIVAGTSLVYTYGGAEDVSFSPTVIAFGTGGAGTAVQETIDLFIKVKIDPEILTMLAGGVDNTSKRWVWRSDVGGVNGHFGVGAAEGEGSTFPGFFAAGAEGASDGLGDPDCIYDDVLVFSVENGAPIYELITGGDTFMNWDNVRTLFPDATPFQFADECRAADDLLKLRSSFNVRETGAGVQNLIIDALSPLSYFINNAEWQILELSEDFLRVRGIQNPLGGGQLAWYFTFVPEGSGGGNGGGSMGERADFDELIFSDEFDTDGAPDPSIWTYELGDGCPNLCGWGNNESQYYTDRPENIVVSDGTLKITALKENFGGSEYTSARIITKDKFEFTFGRVDFRARVPMRGGTWPAAWMLGADIDTNPWPAAGEIDVMEHVGNQANRIFGTTHTPSGFGGSANGSSKIIPDATTEFHVYSIDWTDTAISFYIDDELFYTYSPEQRNSDTYPFDKDFFLLLNMAVGGVFGGTIDPGFTEEVFEIDYVRVYQ